MSISIVGKQEDQDIEKLDATDIENLMRLKGQKLGMLIAGAHFPDDVKQSLIALLPEFSLQQLDDLLAALESAYVLQKSGSAEAQQALQEKLAAILAASREKQQAITDDTLAKLDALGEEIDTSKKSSR